MAGAGDGRVVDVAVVARGGAAAAMFRGFEVESAFAREGTAGGLADADNLPRGLEEEGGYKREQAAFVSFFGGRARGLLYFGSCVHMHACGRVVFGLVEMLPTPVSAGLSFSEKESTKR